MRRIFLSTMILLGLQSAVFAAPPLPRRGPVPEEKPATTEPAETATPAQKPEDEAVSDGTKDNADSKADADGKAANAGTDEAGDTKDDASEDKEAVEEKPAPPPVEKEDPAAYASCIADLKAIGATFTEEEPIDDGSGCGIDKPITVSKVLPGVSLSPGATIRCETALQLARMTKESLIPAARNGLTDKGRLTSINQASGYVCRLRNSASTGKISEHARGNAIDIASLSFGKQTVPMRIVKQEDSTLADAFQRTINAAACLYFTTVLSPGSDATHQDHMHLDVIERNGGYRYCR